MFICYNKQKQLREAHYLKSAKEHIRRYEHLVNQSKQCEDSIEEWLLQEKRWLVLYKDMKKSYRHLSSKQKKEIATYLRKSEEYTHKYSERIYQKMGCAAFGEQKNKYQSIYLSGGAIGLLEFDARKKNTGVDIEQEIIRIKEEEKMSHLSVDKIKEQLIQHQKRASSLNHLTAAFEMERDVMQLFRVLEDKESEQLSSMAWDTFCLIENYILSHLGFDWTISRISKNKNHRVYLKEHGLLKTIQHLEEKMGSRFHTTKELREDISIRHPKEEFLRAQQMKRTFVLHVGPTNSGKTYRAIQRLKQAESGVYLAPIRLLAAEIHEKLSSSGIPCDLVTGEQEETTANAKHRSSTIEMAPYQKRMEVAVVDEMQMIEDSKRGFAWVKAIFGLEATEIHLCTAPHAVPFLLKLIEECGDEYVINRYERQTPLVMEKDDFLFPESVQKGDALVVFSKESVLELSDELLSKGYKVSLIYGKLPSHSRREQVRKFTTGETDVLVATDAIGIGLNLPIKRVVFMESKKFDGFEERRLTTQEVKQIAGRAGRAGIYDRGFVNAVSDKNYIEHQLAKKEDVIKKSVISPTMEIAKMDKGTLRQRLSAWKSVDFDVSYLEKADISEQMKLLSHIERWEHELDSMTLFKSLYIPFDCRNTELRFQWINYVKALKEKKPIQKPKLKGKTLGQLETYYQSLLLYYNFTRKFHLKMDKKWVVDEQKKTTFYINGEVQRSKRERNRPLRIPKPNRKYA